jgi:hypothetical protein
MRSSLAFPSYLFRYQIPGLSDLGNFLISTGLRKIEVPRSMAGFDFRRR